MPTVMTNSDAKQHELQQLFCQGWVVWEWWLRVSHSPALTPLGGESPAAVGQGRRVIALFQPYKEATAPGFGADTLKRD